MSRRARSGLISLALLAALAVTLAACAGGSGTNSSSTGQSARAAARLSTPTTSSTSTAPSAPTTATTAPSKSAPTPPAPHLDPASASFVASADAICRGANTAIVALGAKHATAKEIERVVPRTSALEHRALVALQKLTPPPALAQTWGKMLLDRAVLATALGELIAATKHHEASATKVISATKKRAHAALEATATASGFKDCAYVGARAA